MRTCPDAVSFCLSAAVSALAGKRFLNCLWELTYRCTARCAMCSYWKIPSHPSDELSLPQIREGLERVHAYGCRLINFTGGEPTLRDDLEEIIALAAGKGIWTSIVTNGSLLTRARVRALRIAGLDNLLVSLDSTSPQVHDEQRGVPGSFKKVMHCIEWIREEFLRGHRTGGIMCVISSRNSTRLDDVIAAADRWGVYVLFQPYHANKTGETSLKASLDQEQKEHILRLKDRHPHMLNSRSYLEGMAAFYSGKRHLPCHAGMKYFSIDPYGNLHPCVDLPAVGNLLRDEITRIRNDAAQALVRSCPGCWYCFRGEADTALSLWGCIEKIRLGWCVFRHNTHASGKTDAPPIGSRGCTLTGGQSRWHANPD